MINYFPPSFSRLWKKVTYLFFRFLCFEHLYLRALFMRAKCQQSLLSCERSSVRCKCKQALVQKNNFRRTSTNFQLSKYEDKIFYHQASKNPKMLKESYIQSSQKLLWRKNPWKQVISIAKYSWRGKSDYTEKCRSGLPPSLS